MGYTTKFTGAIALSRKLTFKEAKELLEIAELDRQEAKKITGTDSYLQWVPATTLEHIVWDGGEKFYDYEPLLRWLCSWLAAKEIIANGTLRWRGESADDVGELVVAYNSVKAHPGARTHEPQPVPLTLDELGRMALAQLAQATASKDVSHA